MAGDIWKFYINDKRIMLLWSLLFVLFHSCSGHYCHTGWCNYNEYCCGMNQCCDYLTDYWYYWIMGGVVIFSSIMLCCWLRRRRNRTREDKCHPGYVSYGMTSNYGDPLYYHQQPPSGHYQSGPTEMHYISTDDKGTIPLLREEERLQRASGHYPPPYNYVERPTPTAPPYRE